MNDIFFAIHYFIIFILLGIIGFAVLGRVTKHKLLAYAVAKPIGLALIGYPIWLLSSLKLFNYQNDLVIQVFFLIAAIGATFLILSDPKRYFPNVKDFAIKAAFFEFASLLLFGGYLYIRSFNPSLEGTEKFMDLAMLMSSGKTDFFPFFDFWAAGKDVNYYYYGFYLFSLPIKLSGIPYAVGYNLALGIILVQCFMISGAVVYRIIRSIPAAFFGAALVTFAGNFHYAWCVVNNLNETLATKCYYPSATRIYATSYTINEMPSYSFILGDLHPHVLSIPFFLLGLFLIVLIYKQKKINYLLHGIFVLVASTAALINFWDFITLGLMYGVVVIMRIGINIWNFSKLTEQLKRSSRILFKSAILFFVSVLTALSPLVLFAPFFLHFKSPVTGIGYAPSYVSYATEVGKLTSNPQYPSSPSFLWGIWGTFIVLAIVALLIISLSNINKIKKERSFKFSHLNIVLVFLLTSIFLIVFTELFFFQDLFHIANPYYFRANTVFKLTYHAWILSGIFSTCLLAFAWRSLLKIKDVKIGIAADITFILLISLVFTASFVYPFISYDQAYKPKLPWQVTKDDKQLTLDGTYYIKAREVGDYNLIQWINENVKERSVVVEATGGAYTYFGRIGVNTGMVNISNWETHEWTWRFHYPQDEKDWKEVLKKGGDTGYSEVYARTQEIKSVYEAEDIREAQEVLKKYDVDYIVLGSQERRSYPRVTEIRFDQFGTVVFESEGTKLYKVNKQ